MKLGFKEGKEMMLKVLFPPACPVCGRINDDYEDRICPACRMKLPYIEGFRCNKCSKKISDQTQLCTDCSKRDHVYIQGFSLWQYNEFSRKLMIGIKYKKRLDYMDYMASEIVYHSRKRLKMWKADAIIPVPLHKSKLRSRGYNQAEALADAIGKAASIPVINDVLSRVKKTSPQKHFDDVGRKNNLAEAFYLDENALAKYKDIKRVIIVDDIYTTGSTINACAKLLDRAGIECYFLTPCIGDGF